MWGSRKQTGAPGLLGMSNDDMKGVLRSHGHPVGGTRAVLAQRILDLNLPLVPVIAESSLPVEFVPMIAESSVPVGPVPINQLPDGTTVVNVKVEHIRPEYTDIVQWCADPNNIYIGRQGNGFSEIEGRKIRYPPASKWKNPFTVADHGLSAVTQYETYIRASPLIHDIHELRGKRLGCWCVNPKDPHITCHGQILLKLLAEQK